MTNKKRGRPATGRADTVRITVYIDREMDERIREKIAGSRVTLTAYIAELVRRDLAK